MISGHLAGGCRGFRSVVVLFSHTCQATLLLDRGCFFLSCCFLSSTQAQLQCKRPDSLDKLQDDSLPPSSKVLCVLLIFAGLVLFVLFVCWGLVCFLCGSHIAVLALGLLHPCHASHVVLDHLPGTIRFTEVLNELAQANRHWTGQKASKSFVFYARLQLEQS